MHPFVCTFGQGKIQWVKQRFPEAVFPVRYLSKYSQYILTNIPTPLADILACSARDSYVNTLPLNLFLYIITSSLNTSLSVIILLLLRVARLVGSLQNSVVEVFVQLIVLGFPLSYKALILYRIPWSLIPRSVQASNFQSHILLVSCGFPSNRCSAPVPFMGSHSRHSVHYLAASFQLGDLQGLAGQPALEELKDAQGLLIIRRKQESSCLLSRRKEKTMRYFRAFDYSTTKASM